MTTKVLSAINQVATHPFSPKVLDSGSTFWQAVAWTLWCYRTLPHKAQHGFLPRGSCSSQFLLSGDYGGLDLGVLLSSMEKQWTMDIPPYHNFVQAINNQCSTYLTKGYWASWAERYERWAAMLARSLCNWPLPDGDQWPSRNPNCPGLHLQSQETFFRDQSSGLRSTYFFTCVNDLPSHVDYGEHFEAVCRRHQVAPQSACLGNGQSPSRHRHSNVTGSGKRLRPFSEAKCGVMNVGSRNPGLDTSWTADLL